MRGATVLCVDDAEGILKLYENLFGVHGYEVVSATDGFQALAAHARSPRIDAAILDYDMPGMTGFELAIQLKHRDPTLPIMMVSGVEPDWEKMKPFVDASLTKGVPIRDIIKKIKVLMSKREPISKQ